MRRRPLPRAATLAPLAALCVALASCGAPERGSADSAVAAPPAPPADTPVGAGPGVVPEGDTAAGTPATPAPDAAGTWRAGGNEPFWAVRVDSAGIVFMTPDNQTGVRFPLSPPVVAGDTIRFASTIPEAPGHAIELVIVVKRCPDSMSDKLWTHEAHVTVDGTRYDGCAESTRR